MRGLRPFLKLTEHLTTRTDDSHAAPVQKITILILNYKLNFFLKSNFCLELVRFCVLSRIKPHAPPIVRTSANLFDFYPCGRTNQAEYLTR